MEKKSIVENNPEECYVCGTTGSLERHHIFGGNPGRKLSERYGLTVHLCYLHHRDSKEGVHFNKELCDRLHKEGQKIFEKNHTREEFMEVFKRNYMTDEADETRQQEDREKTKQ
nr:MAG TPA: Recombination enhancement function protein nuclease, DNase, HYDROLASE.4A [Caudoviricetes sp.]